PEHLRGYLCFLFFRRASRRAICEKGTRTDRHQFFLFLFSLLLVLANGFSLFFFLTNSFLSVRFHSPLTMAVASRVSLSDLGFLCKRSISLSVRSSPLKHNTPHVTTVLRPNMTKI
uniref:Uncharacterized protein n=1 Tax=Electrophorus electricus TaxID=8005 RepID=A0A4W4GE51_ELEEL